jgi:hypothetical protein
MLAIAYILIGVYEAAVFAGKIEPRLSKLSEIASADDPALRARLIAEKRNNSPIGVGMALILTTVMLVGLFCPRSPWSWGYGFAPMCVSLFPFCLTIVGVIPLLVFWLKADTKLYFSNEA